MAAVLAGGPAAVLSHRAAADLWDLRPSEARIAITVPNSRPELSRALEVHRTRIVHPSDFTRLHGIPVTSVARTLLDLAAIVSPRRLARAVDRAERLDLFDLAATEEALARACGRRGARALRGAIGAWQPRGTRRELEDRFADLIAESALAAPQFNVLVDGERMQHEVDAFWPEQRLVVELDSFAYHRTRRDLERDAAKTADLELAGFRVVRLTWDDVVVRRADTIRRLTARLAQPAVHRMPRTAYD